MKKTLFSLLALAPAMALAQPSVGPVGSIDVSSVGPIPTDSVVYNGTLIFGEFTNARVGQITSPTTPGSAVVSTLFGVESGDSNLAGFTPVTFDTAGTGDGAGITSLDLVGDTLLVSGSLEDNPGSVAADGLVMTVDMTGPSLILQNGTGLDGGNPIQSGAAFFYDGTNQLFGSFQNGTHFWRYDPATLTSDPSPFIGDGGVGAHGRFQTDSETYDTGAGQEVYVAGNSRFFDPSADLNANGNMDGILGVINVRRYNPDAVAPTNFVEADIVPNATLVMGNGNPEAWYALWSPDSIAANGYQGVGIYDDGSNVWIMLANTIGNELIFVNRATGAADGTLSVTAPTDATMYDDGTDRWLFVSTEGGTIEVFQEGAPTAVQGWQVFQ